ncbi:hypothetical protein Hanom_Chr14g01321301 [Helianthus anomalus]
MKLFFTEMVVIRSDSEGGEVYVHRDGVGALTGSGLADELGFFLVRLCGGGDLSSSRSLVDPPCEGLGLSIRGSVWNKKGENKDNV